MIDFKILKETQLILIFSVVRAVRLPHISFSDVVKNVLYSFEHKNHALVFMYFVFH